jgi:hypothetical protein
MKMRAVFFVLLTLSFFAGCSGGCNSSASGKSLPEMSDKDRLKMDVNECWGGPWSSEPRENPEEAGAVIAESFDITGNITATRHLSLSPGKIVVSPLDMNFIIVPTTPLRIKASYDLAGYDDGIYIWMLDKIFIFDKHSMIRKRVVQLDIPALPFLVSNGTFFSTSGDLTVTGDGAFLLLKRWDRSNDDNAVVAHLFSVDISTGNALELDAEKALGMRLDSALFPLMGYDKVNGLYWFQLWEDRQNSTIYFFRYDAMVKSFKAAGTKKGFPVGEANTPGHPPFPTHVKMAINDLESWTVYHFTIRSGGVGSYEVGIDKRDIDNPENSLHRIDVSWLGTFHRPESFIYDPPYIWIMVEKDDKIQMLKLLPNG